VREILSPGVVAGCLNFAMTGTNGLGISVEGSVALILANVYCQFITGGIQHDLGPTGSLELHEKTGSWIGSKYPRRILIVETSGPRKEGSEPILSQ